VKKKSTSIVINGRRYDSSTGKPLSHAPVTARAAEGHRASSGVPGKQPDSHGAAAYRPTRHIAAHKPAPARTLMRQAVKRPPSGASRRIKVQGRLNPEGGYERSRIISHRPVKSSHGPHTRHSDVKSNKGQVISHFSPHLFSSVEFVAVEPPAPAGRSGGTAPVSPAPPTTDELLEYAVQHASVPQGGHQPHKRHRKLLRRRAHAH
jgi:hypothetical protein